MSTFQVQKVDESPYYKVLGVTKSVDKKIYMFFELYLARNFSTRTIRAYAFDLVVFFRFFQGKKKAMPSLKSIDVKVLLKFICSEKSRNASPASINRRLNTVDIFYRFCFEQKIPGTSAPDETTHLRSTRYITMDSSLGIFPIYAKGKNPFRVRMPQKLVKTLERHEVEQFFSTLNSYRNKSIVLLMLVFGLRSQEVLELKLSDINTFNKTLKILGKGRKERVVPLPDIVINTLEKYLECERPIGKKSLKIEKVFLNQKGPRKGLAMTIEGLRGVFRYNRAVSGIKHANAHRFRHTFGKNMAMAGVSLPVLQKLFGHNHYRTTLKYINMSLSDVLEDFEQAQKEINKMYAKSIH